MGIFDWFKRRWGGGGKQPAGAGGAAAPAVPDAPPGMVRYFDVAAGEVVHIPAAELRPGVVQARIQGIEGVVWVSPDQLQEGPIRHPPFGEDVRVYLRRIQEAFAEHRGLTLEEWEDGFRRDATPEREIALWLHAAEVYTAFAGDEASAERRGDVYGVIVACLTAGPDGVWHVLKAPSLERAEAERIVGRFFPKGAG